MTTGTDDFGDVFRATYPDVLRYLRRRLDRDVAEDIAAEVFAIAWDRWDTVPRAVRPWLFGVARNLLADDHRAQGRRRQLQLRVGSERELPDDPMDFAATSIDLHLAWRRLNDADREVLAMVAWDGLTGREAAAVLGCTRAAFSVRLTRARRRLGALLADAEPSTDSPDPSPVPRATAVTARGGQS